MLKKTFIKILIQKNSDKGEVKRWCLDTDNGGINSDTSEKLHKVKHLHRRIMRERDRERARKSGTDYVYYCTACLLCDKHEPYGCL